MKLYVYGTLNRNMIHDIIINMSSFYNSICLEFLKTKYGNIDGLCNVLQIIENAFENFKTEYVTFQYLQNKKYLIMPSNKTLHSSLTFGQIDTSKKCTIYHRKITIVSMKEVLKKFLEIPNVFSTITAYILNSVRKTMLLLLQLFRVHFGSLLKSLLEIKLFYH